MFEDRIAALNKDTEAMPSIPYEKRIYTVDEIQDILGIGRNSAYNLVKSAAALISGKKAHGFFFKHLLRSSIQWILSV